MYLPSHFEERRPAVLHGLVHEHPLGLLITRGDAYLHLADLGSYLEADARLVELYRQPDEWARKAILNIAASGKFSSDRTIAEYAADIWQATPCPVS